MLLVEPLSEEELNRQLTPILSPLVWDLGHIANFEELWLVQEAGGREPLDGELQRFYDAIENPRSSRSALPILRGERCRAYMQQVRERALEVLEEADLDCADPLLADGFVYELVIAHEHQHSETMLQLLQMVDGYEPASELLGSGEAHSGVPAGQPGAPLSGPEMVTVQGGEYEFGADRIGFAYDNERPRHAVRIESFEIDRIPVSNGAFAEFVADTRAEPPLYWERDGEGGWLTTTFGRRRPLDPGLPVIHVDAGQADAFARWAGKRLPTELEWELAARGSDRNLANLDQLGFGCSFAGARLGAASECGALQMLGDVWEWTSSVLCPYPGFEPFPYREYSEAFFGGGYRVLRGGAWATRRNVIRASFRNWDLPERRQIFSGFRCARTAA